MNSTCFSGYYQIARNVLLCALPDLKFKKSSCTVKYTWHQSGKRYRINLIISQIPPPWQNLHSMTWAHQKKMTKRRWNCSFKLISILKNGWKQKLLQTTSEGVECVCLTSSLPQDWFPNLHTCIRTCSQSFISF